MHRRWIVPAALVLVVAASTVALASIPDSNGVIHACRNKATGALRVIDSDAGRQCLPTEAALTWNQTGPQGPPGAGGTGRELVERSVLIETDPPGSDQIEINQVVQCPAGKAAVNGGYRFDPPRGGFADGQRQVFGGPDGNDWRVLDRRITNPEPYPFGVVLWAVCVSA
jgi:hypothetical protein